MTLTKKQMKADLASTNRDIGRLQLIVRGIEGFMKDSGDEDRSSFRMDLFKYETLLEMALKFRRLIQEAIEKRNTP